MTSARRLLVREICAHCDGDARYTTVDGERTCGLHAMGAYAIRDSDLPEAIRLIAIAIDTFDDDRLDDLRRLMRGNR